MEKCDFYILFLFVGLYFIGQGIKGLVFRLRSNQWLPTKGIIIKSDIGVVSTGQGYIGKMYPILEYKYSVNGREYVSSRIYSSGILTWNYKYRELNEILIPENKEISVYYDPKNPKIACIKKDDYYVSISIIIFGLMFIFLVLFLVFKK